MTHALHRGKLTRKDITTLNVLRSAAHSQGGSPPAYDRLKRIYPNACDKVLYAALEREVCRGLLEVGVSINCPWPTREGDAWLEEHNNG